MTVPTDTLVTDRLLAACLRDYARLLVLQQSLRTPPAEVASAYEHAYGSPLHIEALAENLLVTASSFDRTSG